MRSRLAEQLLDLGLRDRTRRLDGLLPETGGYLSSRHRALTVLNVLALPVDGEEDVVELVNEVDEGGKVVFRHLLDYSALGGGDRLA